MPQFSFDVVSDFNVAELNNAVDQVGRELRTRYDLKGTPASIEFSDGNKTSLKLSGADTYQLDSVLDILRTKLAKRELSQKIVDTSSKPENGNPMRWTIGLKRGISADNARLLSKHIRECGLKKVSANIQGDQLRVVSPSKDDLQIVMAALRKLELDYPIQFTNFR